MPARTPTIVFVHGGWADATGFDGSIRALRDRGFAVIGAANPLRHLTGDAASLAALLGTISGPICPGRPLLWRRSHLERRQRERASAGACLHRWLDSRRG
jgi:hypothetical protein